MIVCCRENPPSDLQLKLDNDRHAQSLLQPVEHLNDDRETFRMSGLFGLIPRTSIEPIRLVPRD